MLKLFEDMHLDYERMSDAFEKWHIRGLPFPAVLHRFSAPDTGDPHDHPWPFTTHILAGGYVEQVWEQHTPLTAWGPAESPLWRPRDILRSPGTAHLVEATHIHRIIALPMGECWTLVLPGLDARETRFWRFNDAGVQSRAWHEDWPC